MVITAWRRVLFLPLSSPLFDSSRVDRDLSRATALIPLVYIVIFPVLLRWFLSCRSGSFPCYCVGSSRVDRDLSRATALVPLV